MPVFGSGTSPGRGPGRGSGVVECAVFVLDMVVVVCELADPDGPGGRLARPLATALRGVAQWMRRNQSR